jgi:hypothetical protein
MTDNKNDSANSEQADTASSITIEQVNQAINAAISNRFKSFEKKFEEFATKLTPPDKIEEPKKDEKLSNAEMQALKKQLENIQKERDTEVSNRRNLELRNSVKENLLKAGVSPAMVKAAMAVLVDSDKVVGYDEADQIVFKSATGDMDLASGLKTWAKSEEGKAFVAPRGAIGSGEKSFGKVNSNTSAKPSRQEVGAMLEEALFAGMKDQ